MRIVPKIFSLMLGQCITLVIITQVISLRYISLSENKITKEYGASHILEELKADIAQTVTIKSRLYHNCRILANRESTSTRT